MNYVYVIMILD